MNRGDLTNEQWARLEPLLPPQKPKTGRPNAEHRRMLNGMLWILRTGAAERDLPEHYGPWCSVASRFYRWRESGVWDRALSALQVQANAEGRLDWDAHLVDATIVRAHQHAAGAKKSAGESAEVRAAVEALGYSQGGFSTKVHLRAEGQGKAMVIVLTPGQQHEATVFEALLEQGAVRRPGRGRPRRRPRRGIGDKSYSAKRIRGYLRQRGMRITIPRKRNECRSGPFNRAVYRTRNCIERLINRCKQFRRLATRYEKRAVNYRAMWLIAVCLLWL